MYDLAGNSNPLIASLAVSSSKTLRNLGASGTITDKDCLNDPGPRQRQDAHGAHLGRPSQDIQPRISDVGRQMVDTGTASIKSMTTSNSEFDSRTQYSATSGGNHYWDFLFLCTQTQGTLANDYVHNTPGSSPGVGGNFVVHAVKNYWSNNTGYSYKVVNYCNVLLEGDYFEHTATPNKHDAETVGAMMAPSSSPQSTCKSTLRCPSLRPMQCSSLSGVGPRRA
ncbi:hypothetical protein PF010_g22675 [Phytophthora fragariae]|uniref:Pectate lyase n=1 Tax=Phytophthora fragariae TaxID=53985 RepID=A0A6G0MNZ7_9STRA|nr:hypothetical protein PF010_g22675 [Phytophthora fragariae]KAE9175948.1 hypothetical protein PF004_g26237 [Phytophthora fragariae]